MWIKIICFIFIFIVIVSIYHFYRRSHIEISSKIEDIPLLLNNTVACIHIKDFYPKNYCDILLKRMKEINNQDIKPWRYSDKKNHDVSIFQIPLSNVFNELSTPEEYFHQKEWNLYDGIPSPIDYFISECHKYNVDGFHKGKDDCIIGHFPIYKKFENNFLESIVRIYKPNTYHKDGLQHVDIDETGYYGDYDIYSINIYLKVPSDGGELTIGNMKIKPSVGDLILFNPSYNHSVRQSMTEDRISVQSFILSSKKKKKRELFIRV